ncbi:hypothetical protein BDZ89DRAFT_1086487 [Hymenopellis radicata]|nr:hypothetical protein BDZ89DRAFT_1086487 [Hymenopellis radicata]
MDAELKRLRLEIERLEKNQDQILKERNQYLSQVQHERTRKAELSNQLLTRDSEINDLKRTNQDLSEQLELALSTLSRTSTRSPLRATPAKPRRIPRMSVSVEVTIPPKSKASSSRTAIAPEPPIVVSDDEEDASVKPKGEASSPIRGEKPAGEDLPPGPSSLEASDNDDPFADDFELLQKDQTLSPPAEEQKERSLSPLSIISSPPSSRATTEFTDLPASSDLSNPKDDEMDADTTKPESSTSGLKRKREAEEPMITSTPKKKGSSSKTKTGAKGPSVKKFASLTKLYLSNIPNFTIAPPPEPGFFFSREEFSHCIGGSTQPLIVTPKNWKPSSRSGLPIKCIWPGKLQNPLTVDSIGAPGLMFASRPDILSDPPLYMFRQVEIDGHRVWEYCGNYEATTVGRLEAEHFKMCSGTARTKWSTKIATCKNKDYGPYVAMRAITPERVGREVRLLIKGEKGKGMDITTKDAMEALCDGDEHLDIILMRCVGYDHAFMRDMRRDITAYAGAEDRPPKKRRVESGKGKGKKKQQSASASPSLSPPPAASEEYASGRRRSKRERKPVMRIDDDDDDD